jgi:hypothetical protein
MTDEQKKRAIEALSNARLNITIDQHVLAEQWAATAVSLIKEANLSTRETCRLMAPFEEATDGDKAAIILSAGVLVWMIVSMVTGEWTL